MGDPVHLEKGAVAWTRIQNVDTNGDYILCKKREQGHPPHRPIDWTEVHSRSSAFEKVVLMMRCAVSLFLVLVICSSTVADKKAPLSRLADATPAEVGLDASRLARIDNMVAAAIKEGKTPGAVVLVVRKGKVAFRKAYGQRQIQPQSEAMTPDSIFDLASLTKPMATATAILLLIERGKLHLDDHVATHLPAFAKQGKDRLTVEQLLLHTSGLPAGNPVRDYDDGRVKAMEKINDLRLLAEPGKRFVYSDLNFILLGELVEKLTGSPLDVFCRNNIFEPLGLRDTMFRPGKDLSARMAPTERANDHWLRGEVHDPRARRMSGVAGHAGLFGTADDLAVYSRMILDGGTYIDNRILSPESVRLMTQPRRVPGGQRALGWDVRTRYSSNRGERFGGFGHTGFTGTSLWIDPPSRTAVIVLTNRVHPNGKGNVVRLRSQIATIVADAIIAPPFPETQTVRTGIDMLKREGFKRLAGRRVGLVTNHTGVDGDGVSTIDLLHKAPGVKLVALFSPEHGIRGELDRLVSDGTDERTGLPVYSIYGKNRRPTTAQLHGIDTLVYDIQDIGCRFYTYLTTLGYVLETAAEYKLRVVVLDRPNPIGGVAIEGPMLGKKFESFVAYHPLPVRHGLTLGELALLFNKERKIGASLEVIEMEGWRREDLFDRTGLVWRNPSPNMRSLTAALLYPGIGLLETTNVSVGRGTDRPFEVIGAPWLDGRRLAVELIRARLPGMRFVPTEFTPSSSTYAKKPCGGVQLYIDDWGRFESLRIGLTIAATLRQLYPKEWKTERYNVLLCNAEMLSAIEKGEPAEKLLKLAAKDVIAFEEIRRKYLRYR
jgi:uncharacterized protein YbbC (DUF1343 family)